MPNVLVTNQGMQFITSAHDNGIYIDLRYFIPVYDDRIDPTMRSELTVSATSAIADSSITEPFGEKLWAGQKYDLIDRGVYIVSASDFSGNQMQGSYQANTVQTNVFNETPLSNQVFAANGWDVKNVGSTYTWSATDGVGVDGFNQRPLGTFEDFFIRQDYYAVYDTSSEENVRGSFKCVIDENIGNVKFNKIALYAVAVDSDGSSITDIIFFGEAYLSNPVVRSSVGVGYDRFEYDIQIDVSGVSASFENLFFSSSADYWSHSPGGLYYPGKVGVGSFTDDQKALSATMQIRRSRDGNGLIDTSVPQLRIDHDDNKYWTIEVVSDAYDLRSEDVVCGDMVIGPGEIDTGDALAIKPSVDSTISLGTFEKSFRELWLWNYDGGDDFNLDDIIPLNVQNMAKNYAAQFNENQVLIGKSDGVLGDDKFALRIDDLGVEITNGNNLYGAFKGGDILRDNENLLIYNTTNGDNGSENIYLFAGLNSYYDFQAIDGQIGPTHKNIMDEIEQYGLISTGDDRLASEAELHIAARGQIGLHGPIEIQSLTEDVDGDKNNAIMLSRESQYLMFIGAGVLNTTTHDIIIDRMNRSNEMIDLVHEYSNLYLISDSIKIDSTTIMPLRDGRTNLGTMSNKFNNLYVDEINSGRIMGGYARFIDTLEANNIEANSINFGDENLSNYKTGTLEFRLVDGIDSDNKSDIGTMTYQVVGNVVTLNISGGVSVDLSENMIGFSLKFETDSSNLDKLNEIKPSSSRQLPVIVHNDGIDRVVQFQTFLQSGDFHFDIFRIGEGNILTKGWTLFGFDTTITYHL